MQVVLKVNVTDMVLFQRQYKTEYLGCRCVVHLNRSDSIWNYRFIIDSSVVPRNYTQKRRHQPRSQKVSSINLALVQRDGWRGEDQVCARSLDIDAPQRSFVDKQSIQLF